MQAEYLIFSDAISSKTDFWKSDIDASYYHGFGARRVLGFNYYFNVKEAF